MGYFYPKNTFLQLEHFILKIYLTLVSTTCEKIHRITYVIFETIYQSFLSTHFLCISLAQTLHTFYKSSPSTYKFSDFPLLGSKFTKFLMSFFKQNVSFSLKFGSFFSVMKGNFSILFLAETLYAIEKSSTSKCKLSKLLMPFFKPQVNFPINFAIYTVQCHDS